MQSISFISSTVTPSAWDNRRCVISPNIISLLSEKRCAKCDERRRSSAPLEGKVAAPAPRRLPSQPHFLETFSNSHCGANLFTGKRKYDYVHLLLPVFSIKIPKHCLSRAFPERSWLFEKRFIGSSSFYMDFSAPASP